MKNEIVIDSFGQEHIIMYKSESEWISYPKAIWDELEATKEANGTLS